MAFFNVLLLMFVASYPIAFSLENAFDVTQYGAKGDGKTDDRQAFLKAWGAVCGAHGGTPTLHVPRGKTFFLNPLAFNGPCKSRSIQVQIDGTLVAPSSKGAWKQCEANTWIIFQRANGLNILGSGTLDAKGHSWWDQRFPKDWEAPSGRRCLKPTTFRLLGSSGSHLMGLKFVNSGGSHIDIVDCNDLYINNITITAPKKSPNTDGIDIISSKGVQIRDCNIGTGDDCIAINTNCFNVNISGIACGPGHGISIGSLGNGFPAAVDGIYVEHCTFIKTQASARIKTWPGGSGYAKNIFYDHITLDHVYESIEIDQHYLGAREQPQAVQVSRVHFTNVIGTAEQITLDCSQHKPCQEIYLRGVNIGPSRSGIPVNVTCKHAKVGAESVTPPLSCIK